jgi:eukaryotic-like serine/threonine-protein kinase
VISCGFVDLIVFVAGPIDRAAISGFLDMTPERWQQIDQLFHAVLACEPARRADFLDSACNGDEPLRQEVESLISSHEDADSFIETPAGDVAAGLLSAHEFTFEPGQQINNYRIVRPLGSGGMGEVYLAEDTRLGRNVALKILPAKFTVDAQRVHRFELEARAASALNHPNIITIHEIGKVNSTQFIVTEFVEGQTLRERMVAAQFSMGEALEIATQVAGALEAAHAAGIVHRDIKPENIMLRADGYVKVLDFGLAKLTELQAAESDLESTVLLQSNPGLIMGTVQYMSPEQARGRKVDARTDIWSIGIVLYELLSGQVPFSGDTASHVMVSLMEDALPPLTNHANVPAELDRIVTQALRKNQNERYQSASQLTRDLKALIRELQLEEHLKGLLETVPGASAGGRAVPLSRRLAAETVTVRPEGTGGTRSTFSAEYLATEIKRHKSFAVAALLVLLVGAVGLTYFFRKSNKTDVSPGRTKSIAVLPVKPIYTANRDEIYEIGIADSLIQHLSSVKGLLVRPLSVTRQYAALDQDPLAAGREQKVDYVLTANYQIANGRIKITAQLLDVASGQSEDTYKTEKDLANIFAAQDAIASEVAGLLISRFATSSSGRQVPKRGTSNEEAYLLYWHGKNLTAQRNADADKKAIASFEQAIRLDPNYARAYAGMANAYRSLFIHHGRRRENSERANDAIKKAFELDNNLAEAFAVRGIINFAYEWNFPASEKDLAAAVELEPNNDTAHWGYALLSAYQGRFDKAMAEIETVLAIAPGTAFYENDRGRILYYSRRYDEAIVQLKRTIELKVELESAWSWLRRAYEMKGDDAGAFDSFIKSRKNPERIEAFRKAYETAGYQAVERKFLEFSKLDEQPGSNFYEMAIVSLRVGEREQAFAYLNKAVETRQWEVASLNIDPQLDNLRADPRFTELVKRVGLK